MRWSVPIRPRARRSALATGLAALVALLAATLLVVPRPANAAGPRARTAWEKSVISQLVSQVNGYRAQHGLRALRAEPHLSTSARTHSWRLALNQSLVHQEPGESDLGSRVSAAGYGWSWVGENIGYTSDRSAAGARRIIALMYAEQAPNDSHRRNMLSRNFAELGMDVYDDAAHGRLWLTTDFGHR